jgi:glycosyltransferase involved in cell wall biosynthesis
LKIGMKSLSVIIPAFNEERFLGETLQRLQEAVRVLRSGEARSVQILVVDNASTDRTATVARGLGAQVIPEPVRKIARARNAGARCAQGDTLFFLDADTLVPPPVLSRVAAVMINPLCVGGAVDVLHRPLRASLRLYLRFYRLLGRLTGMAQGAAQFWDRGCFCQQGGYDETIFMGEDVDFYWRMSRAARRQGKRVCYVNDLQVVASPRRFDHWPLWKTLLWTNPLVITLLRRRQRPWRGWYEDVPR